MVLRDGDPCQFWPGSVYYDDVCYKVVQTKSSWRDGQLACEKDHRQSWMAEITSIQPIRFLSLYSSYMENKYLEEEEEAADDDYDDVDDDDDDNIVMMIVMVMVMMMIMMMMMMIIL
ncbi:hypothetical protein ElyMa_005429900 [Elysia marginata]|uniref:C-type lectin domain-containing protein n=1 Tax=Elysia marginata TaxID=1093978 RepID=A0AAV4EJI9_9GAST|nr:hypothetical protein ElyMa_005429900 [Elysia marginata]